MLAPEPPTLPLMLMAPAAAVNVRLADAPFCPAIEPVMVMSAPTPLVPAKPSPVVLNVVLALKVVLAPTLNAPAVKIVPAVVKLLGAETVSEPNTLKLSPAPLLTVNAPRLLKVNA